MKDNVVSEEQMLESLRTIREFVESIGGDPYAIEFDKPKPKGLPLDVSQAWDTYKSFWNRMQSKGIIP